MRRKARERTVPEITPHSMGTRGTGAYGLLKTGEILLRIMGDSEGSISPLVPGGLDDSNDLSDMLVV